MRKEFKMEQDELDEIYSIAKSQQPVMKFGDYWSGMDTQEIANAFWKILADKYGFVLDSAEGVSGKSNHFFTAQIKV